MHCQVCGDNLPADAMFCPKCGERRKGDAVSPTPTPQPNSGMDRFKQGLASKMSDPKHEEHETELWHGSYSGKAMVGGWIVSFIVTVVAFVAGAFFGPPGWTVAALVSLAVWGGYLAQLIYQKLAHSYKLTTQRFIHASGVFGRTIDRIEVIDIDDVQVTQGFVQRMLGVGTIKILSSDITSPITTLSGINEVTRIATLIDDTRRTERRKRSVHIESV